MNGFKIGTRWYLPQVETRFIVMNPITTSRLFSGRANAYCLQNAGNCDLLLSNGFTLAPGQNMWFGNYQELNVMSVDVQITFLPATATDPENPIQRLEVIEVLTKFTGSGFWIEQPAMDIINTAPR